ncbi:unnamed protein product [Fusarium equiseti]|uniref:SMP-30/Gluconolactonase/LRE-like region domain-containing protein n=1 Tax=Fusarium equiseti TaxID=61235 RepID=A0A8J2NCZ7_FUSEQ|nr:unnamed protein product [Fusarium equiseti]
MVNILVKIGLSAVIALAVLFQIYLKDAVWLALGVGKVFQPISDFPYTCRKIVNPRMEACEDMWLSKSTRQLFLACSDPLTREKWFTNVGHLNVSGRSEKDAIVVLDLESDSFEPRVLETPGFTGTSGDGLINVAGFTGIDNADGSIDILITNMRPSVDETGKLLDQYVHGGNTTIERFTTRAGMSEMKHVKTHADRGIATPNRVAAMEDGTFYITNDHGPHKTGWRHHLSPILGYANINACPPSEPCKEVSSNLHFPNGLAIHDNTLYLPDSITGVLTIYNILRSHELNKTAEMKLDYALDNASVDENGDIWIAAFPKGIAIFESYKDPYGFSAPAAVMKVTKGEEGWKFEKVLEDGLGEILPVATTVVHDAKTGRLFLSSVISPWIAVCEPKV